MITRVSNREKYTMIDQTVTYDLKLSAKALGILTKLLSLPDNWDFN
ncbi:MAG: hypothetical protein FWE84_02180 [Firmicutes bacterium]|nr:hypothetical protein [Bacillota bacterium]